MAGESLEGSDVSEHLEACAACRALLGPESLREDAGGEAGEAELSDLRAAVLARRASGVGELRERLMELPTALRRRLLALAALVALGVAVSRLRPDFAEYPAVRMQVTLLALALLALFSAQRALWPLYEAPRRGGAALLTAAFAAPWLVAGLWEAHTGHAASGLGPGDAETGRALACLSWGGALALVPLSLLRAFDRLNGSEPVRTLAAIAATALLANLALQLHCPLTPVRHLLLGHAPIGVALGLGWLVLRAGSRLRHAS
jgi:hypothetical protein